MQLFAKLQHWLLKRSERQDQTTLTSRKIYILPTREGVIYAIIVLVILAAAINFNNSLVFFFAFTLVGIGIISMHMTQANLIGLNFSLAHTQPTFCFQALNLPLVITQSKRGIRSLSDHYSIEVQISQEFANASSSSGLSLHEYADVYKDEETILPLAMKTIRRGYFQPPPLTISTKFPFGLFRAWANIQLVSDAIVYPNPAKQSDYLPEDGNNNDGQGNKGRGFDDFSGFKSYQQGESLKHIHWKAYAREQGLLSKTFSGSNNREYWLNFDHIQGNLESRLSQLCRLVIDAQLQGDRYGLRLPNLTINISQGPKHQHQCLNALALFKF